MEYDYGNPKVPEDYKRPETSDEESEEEEDVVDDLEIE